MTINYKDVSFYTFFRNGLIALDLKGRDENNKEVTERCILLFDRKYKAIKFQELMLLEAEIKRVNFNTIKDQMYKKYKDTNIKIIAGSYIKEKLKDAKGIYPEMFLAMNCLDEKQGDSQ